ncbi:MAG: hypothetical protein JSS95_14310 [Acidobacteria bacterium]|nr:hypothetical protein [Acidobacteriota bacterium]
MRKIVTTTNIQIDTSDGFVNLRIPVLNAQLFGKGEASLLASGSLLGQSAAIEIHIEPGLKPNNDLFNEKIPINAGFDGIQFLFQGNQGHHFAEGFFDLYQISRRELSLPIKMSFTAVALYGEPANIATEFVKFKLFHDEGSTDEEEGPDYFEMFLNIDLPSGYIELNEKDTEFRSGVLFSLASQFM